MKLLFITNQLLNPDFREASKLPFEFVCFAHTNGKMYRYFKEIYTTLEGGNGNDVVYGAIYVLNDEYFHLRTVDAFHNCSMNVLGRNHDMDLQHRVRVKVTPIQFSSIDELSRLRYTELESIDVELYTANTKHPKIKKCIARTQNYNYRIKSGVNRKPFLAQYRGIQHDEGQ